MKTPIRCTYRWQLHKDFTFRQAEALVPYLDRLGVSHVYVSPFFRATPGSVHGYDVCDHNEINPEIGSRAALESFAAALHRHGMGLIADFVPNHMGIADPGNFRWMDVLENGPASPYSQYFDIEWQPVKRALENKVLLPILGDQYGMVLERGDLQIRYRGGVFTLECPGATLPVATRSTMPVLRRAAALMESAPEEFLSIITSIDHLPPRDAAEAAVIEERRREKRVIQQRLKQLEQNRPEVTTALEAALREWNDVSGEEGMARLDALLSDQPYRLSFWKVAAEEINYRRFFDINSLAAIRVDHPQVFEETHRLLFELIGAGILDGVRIDHIDGLALPGAYLAQLRARIQALAPDTTAAEGVLYVEKILAAEEAPPRQWPVDGTTGYEFAVDVMNVLLKPSVQPAVTRCYERFVESRQSYREIVNQSKRLIMQLSMASEINMLGTLLSRLAESHRRSRDFTLNALTTAIREVVAAFPVYRSYIEPGKAPGDEDTHVIQFAIAQARRRNRGLERSVFEFVRKVLLPSADDLPGLDESMRWAFVMRFQQCTGPVAAKGIEDTAFYRYHRLVALNEVGGEPGAFGMPLETFHRRCAEKGKQYPRGLLATSTHDTKRSEDVRCRILVLGELVSQWSKAVLEWRRFNRRHKMLVDGVPAPDANEEYLLYQTLIGTWPLEAMDEAQRLTYLRRMQEYLVKAIREAKVNSSWVDPNSAWDEAAERFVARILTPGAQNRFLHALTAMAEKVAPLGAMVSLSQTLLKLTVPGVPDLYQGTETWDFSLVDPDNRRPVDYEARSRALERPEHPRELMASWRDGRIKTFVIQKLLALRRDHPLLFAEGVYAPCETSGEFAVHLVAFRRVAKDRQLLVVAPRWTGGMSFPPTGDCWGDTRVATPGGGLWRNGFTGSWHEHEAGGSLALAEILQDLPFAVLERQPDVSYPAGKKNHE